MIDLDSIDLKILGLLFLDSSLTNKEIADRLEVPKTTCLERTRRLRSQGVIQGYCADLDLKALGVNLQAMVSVCLNEHSNQSSNLLRDEMLGRPEVVSVYHVGGEYDFNIHLAVKDTDHLRDFVFEALTSRPEVGKIQTELIFEHKKSSILPVF